MAEKTFAFLVPVYYKNFKCIGSKCEDSCCKNWDYIFVDKATYMKIKNLRKSGVDKDFVDKLSAIVRVKHDVDISEIVKNEQYARISFVDENRRCPMLNDNSLCEIYINLGEEYMCKTCKAFPRKVNIRDNCFEASLCCSCPEVVRKAVYNENGLDFEYITMPESQLKLHSAVVDFSNKENQATYKKYFDDIRSFMIDILQCRLYNMDDRMIILGIFCNKINSSTLDEIPAIIESYIGLLNLGAFNEHLSRFDTDTSVKHEVTDAIISTFSQIGSTFEIVQRMKEDIADALKMSGDTLDYAKLQPFMDNHSYMLENYMVNYIFSEMAIFHKFDSLWDIYVANCVIYSYLKYVLTAVLTKYGELDTQKLTDTFVAVDKILAHNLLAIVSIVNSVSVSKAYTLPAMITIIKN